MTDRLAEIKARWSQPSYDPSYWGDDDVRWLVAEIEALRTRYAGSPPEPSEEAVTEGALSPAERCAIGDRWKLMTAPSRYAEVWPMFPRNPTQNELFVQAGADVRRLLAEIEQLRAASGG